MSEVQEKLTNDLLEGAVRDMEQLQSKVVDYRARFTQIYGVGAANLLKECLEQRAIAREASDYARDLMRAPDLPEDDD